MHRIKFLKHQEFIEETETNILTIGYDDYVVDVSVRRGVQVGEMEVGLDHERKGVLTDEIRRDLLRDTEEYLRKVAWLKE